VSESSYEQAKGLMALAKLSNKSVRALAVSRRSHVPKQRT